MVGVTASPKEIVKHLNSLIALDYDAAMACQASIDRLDGVPDQAQVRSFMADHRRHILDLAPFVREYQGEPVAEADRRSIVAKGKVLVMGMLGVHAVLEALESNEETVVKAYHKAWIAPGLPLRVRAMLEQNLHDDRRHLAWLQQRLGEMTFASQGR
jgi:hypothetical protein